MAIDSSYTVTALTGKQGESGQSAIEVYLGFSNINLSCDKDGKLKDAYSKSLSVITYTGTTKVASTITVTSNTSNIEVGTITNGTTSSNGSVPLSLSKNSTVTNGTITLSIVAGGVTITKDISVGSTLDGASGDKGDRGSSASSICFRVNKSTFVQVNSGEVYTCGYDANGGEADVPGYVIVDGTTYYAKGMTNTNCACNGYLVIPTTAISEETVAVPVLAYEDGNGSWFYLKNSATGNYTVAISDADRANWVVLAKMYQFSEEGKCTVEPMTPCLLSSVTQEIEYHFEGLVSTVTQYTSASISPYKITQSNGTFSISAGSAMNANRGAIVLNINAVPPTAETAEMKIQFYNGTYWNEITSTDKRYPIAIALVAGYLPAIAGYYNTLGLTVPTICGTYIETLTSNSAFINDLFANEISVGNIIKSSNYASGTSGFKLSSDGKAEINELTINSMKLSYDNKNNLALGNSVLAKEETTGTYNLGIGYKALYNDTTGSYNVGIGYYSGSLITTGSKNIAIGYMSLGDSLFQALGYNTTGNNNIAIGSGTMCANTTGHDNVALGSNCLSLNLSGYRNVAIGSSALSSSYDSDSNVAIGYITMQSAEKMQMNVAIGYMSMTNAKNSRYNICIGPFAGSSMGACYNCVAIGSSALCKNTGYYNVAIGTDTMTENTTGTLNVALGYSALYKNTTGNNNVAVGYQSLFYNTTGYVNVGIGNSALEYNTTGHENVAVGDGALGKNKKGFDNIAIGSNALGNAGKDEEKVLSMNSNIGIGIQALYNCENDYNIAIGNSSLRSNVNGGYNVGIGFQSLYKVDASNNIAIGPFSYYGGTLADGETYGDYNISIGQESLYKNTTGNNNVALGYFSLHYNTTGNNNVALGNNSLGKNTTGYSNVALGSTSLANNTTGTLNVALGYSALSTNTTGTKNICIGYNTQASAENASSEINIGNNLFVQSNKLYVGTAWDSKSEVALKSDITATKVSSITYQSGTSATTAPTGTWQATVPTVSQGNYLWTKVAYTDNTTSYSVARQGTDGKNGSVTSVNSKTGAVTLTASDVSALPLSGGNMKGNISYTGSKSTNSMIRFIDNTSDAYGNGISIGGGGVTIIGSGEAASNCEGSYSAGAEKLILASDEDIVIYTNTQSGVSSATKTTIDTSGVFSGTACNIPTTSGKGNIWIA